MINFFSINESLIEIDFVDVVWLFCAPLWIFSGSVRFTVNNILSKIKLATLELFSVDQDTKVTMRLCNLIDLPDSEIDRGQEHVDKVVDGFKPMELPR